MSLATKYRPQEFSSVCEQDTIINIVSRLCEQEDLENRNFLFIGPAGCGKAEPLTSKILTTSGFKLMKDIQIGDEVFTGSGNCGKVTGIYPQGVRPIYRITLQDRTFIDVSDEHLNVVYRYNEDKKQRQDYVVTTKDLIELFNKSRFKLRIDIPEVNWEHKDVPIDPYLLGALIGDGSLTEGNCVFSNSEYDIVNKVDQKLRDNFNCYLDKNEGDNVDYSIRRLDRCKNKYVYSFKGELFNGQDSIVNKLVSLGYPKFDPATIHRFILKGNNRIAKNYPELIGSISIVEDYSENFQISHPVVSMLSNLGLNTKSIDKHIPEMYLMNSKEVRLELLQGLFDTDGYISKEGSAVYTTCSSKLSEDFAFLVRSLGIRDTVVSYPAKYRVDGEWIFTGSTAYDHNLKIPNELEFCTSNKHLSRRMLHQNPPMRNIVSIERIEDEECQCIMIGHPDHTYISSEGFIPTHNTTTARIMAKVLNEGKENSTIEMDAASHNGVESVREIINQARMYPVGTKYKVFIIDECFPGSIQVNTSEGKKRISDVNVGDSVAAFTSFKKVTNTFKNQVPCYRLIYLELSDGTQIVTTLEHRFYTSMGWIEAKNLKESMYLCRMDFENISDLHQPILIKSEIYNPGVNDGLFLSYFSEEELKSGTVTMYDLEVEEEHCYFVNDILVHNCHAFSPQAWQIWLKPLEDAPAKSIYIFCLDKDSLVPSENGLKKISELSPGEKVWTGEKYDVISNVFNNGKKPCIKLKLRNGQSITCTKNHEILVLRGDKETWVSAGDVSVGDNILVYTNIDTNCLNNKLDISESEAFFLGYLTGNGSYTSHDMHLYTPPKKWDRLQPILDELVSQGVLRDYLKQSDLNTTDNVLVTRIYFPKNGMNLWYSKVGADPNYTRGTKSIPKCVYSMDDNLFRSFVDGWYFADGCGRFDSFYDRKRGSGGYSAYLYSNSPSLIYDLQNLLLYHGYYSTVSKHESIGEITPGRTLEDKVVVSYAIYLRYQYGNFLNDDFARILKSKYDEMPRGKYLLDLSNIKQYPVRKITPQMLRDAGYGYFVDKGAFDTVVAIEDAGIKEVYDLEVPETSSFICNGIKVHNCTTNPEKIPATIISRVQTFQLSKISLKGIFDRLCYIIEQENKEGAGITYTDDAVNYISKLASGGMRDAITNLDKVLAFTHDLTSESVAKALNLPEYDDYFKLLAAYSKKDNKIVSEVINDVYNSGVNFVKWFEGFHSFVMNVVKYIFLQDINLTMIPSHYQSKISKYGTAHSVVCLKLANKLLKLNYELKTTQYLQEVALTYLCQLPKKGE